MAQIAVNLMQKVDKEKNSIHDIVPAKYTIFEKNGEKFFQIDTYGKGDRKNPEKISQSLQLDKENALLLSKLILNEMI